MECWISKISCLACWEWWDLAVATVSAITAWFTTKFFLGRKIERLEERNTIKDFERFQEITNKWEAARDPKTGIMDRRTMSLDEVYEFIAFSRKYEDWLYLPHEKTSFLWTTSKRATWALRLIRLHGDKAAKKLIRKELYEEIENEKSRVKRWPWENT